MRKGWTARYQLIGREDREFLPAALEILETPPSPARVALLLAICAFTVVTLAWGWFGQVDVIALALGEVVPVGRVKVIQPASAGKVERILACNGASVRAGDVLIELDASEAQADVAADEADLHAVAAEAARRRAGLALVEAGGPALPIAWPLGTSDELKARESRVLIADLAQLAADQASFQAQIDQKQAEQARLRAMIAAESALVATERERLAMKQLLEQRAAGSRADVLTATEALQSQETVLVQREGELEESRAAEIAIAREARKTETALLATYSGKLADAEREFDELRQKLAKARTELERMTLRSPIDGIVQSSTVTTIGQVLAPGQEVMRIVPRDRRLEIAAYLPDKDRAFVAEGDQAVIKVNAFPFTRYGTLSARVAKVASDAIPSPDAVQSEADAARALAEGTEGGGESTQNLVYPVTLELKRTSVKADGVVAPILPGMTVEAEISTGRRRILDYIFSPLAETLSQSMRGR